MLCARDRERKRPVHFCRLSLRSPLSLSITHVSLCFAPLIRRSHWHILSLSFSNLSLSPLRPVVSLYRVPSLASVRRRDSGRAQATRETERECARVSLRRRCVTSERSRRLREESACSALHMAAPYLLSLPTLFSSFVRVPPVNSREHTVCRTLLASWLAFRCRERTTYRASYAARFRHPRFVRSVFVPRLLAKNSLPR